MSLQAQLNSFVLRVAQEFNTAKGRTGDLAALATVDKSSLVAAINELQAQFAGGGSIDDGQVSTGTTYSSDKIVTLLAALKAEILGGADAAYDTLLEIQQALTDGDSGLTALLGAINDRVRFDAAQTLTEQEQAQARANIAAVASSDIGDTTVDLVAVFEAALA